MPPDCGFTDSRLTVENEQKRKGRFRAALSPVIPHSDLAARQKIPAAVLKAVKYFCPAFISIPDTGFSAAEFPAHNPAARWAFPGKKEVPAETGD